MKKIFENSTVQVLVAILVLISSYIIGALQGYFGFILPFALLILFILLIILVFYIIVIPLMDFFKPKEILSSRIYTVKRLTEYELSKNIREIWIITTNLQLAFDNKYFSHVIQSNISRGVKYRFYINSNNISVERAIEMKKQYNSTGELFEVFILKEDLVFVDQNTDYDLFFTNNGSNNMGVIGITIDGVREYVTMSQEMFIKLKVYLEGMDLDLLEG